MRFSTKLFSYDARRKEFYTEMSTLEASATERRVFSQIYEDACDEGLTLVSHATGKEVDYVVSKIKRKENEIQSWELIPIAKSIRRVRQCAGTRIIIFND